MTTETAPLLVIDAGDMHKYTNEGLDALHTWMREQSLDPNDVQRIEIREVDGKLVGTVTEVLRDMNGHRYADPHGNGSLPADKRVHDVPLTSLPEGDVFARHRAKHPEPLVDCMSCTICDVYDGIRGIRDDIRECLEHIHRVITSVPTEGKPATDHHTK